ncbi:MAG: transporter substrate-binding domain-containing protein [Rhodobacteraceae bacterium]|nr:transporter substrate-binding domain-containing protein [Paracoccaceae bacterium]
MRVSTLILAAILSGGPVATAAAQDVVCGEIYSVQRGDTLHRISRRAYGNDDGWRLIFSVNREIIGANPSLIEIGQPLTIPCLEKEVAEPTTGTETIRRETTAEPLPPPLKGGIRFVTASDWAPFSSEEQEQGGMMTEVVNAAMSKVRPAGDYQIDFINDWGAHLQPLLTDNAYDFGFPWFRPNCDVIEKLGEGSKFRCNNLFWSEPIYEQIIGFYTTTEFDTPLSHSDLFGSRLCRPEGYSIFMLEERDLVAPNVTLMMPVDPSDCFDALLAGDADVVALAEDVARGIISDLDGGDRVVKQDALDAIATLHVVISKNNPNAQAYLELLNEGINELKDSGEWFEIVRRHLAEFMMRG